MKNEDNTTRINHQPGFNPGILARKSFQWVGLAIVAILLSASVALAVEDLQPMAASDFPLQWSWNRNDVQTVSSLSNREDENPVELKNSVRLSMPAPIERSRGSARVVTIESIGPDGFIDFSTAKKINDYSMPVEPEWSSSELPSFLTDRTDIVAAAPALDGFSPILPDLQPEGIVDREGDGEFSSRFGLPGNADLQAALATLPRLADQTPQTDDFGGFWVDGFDFMSEAGPAHIQTGPEAMRIETAEIPASEDHYWSQLPSPNDIPFFHGDHELQLIAP